jgi:Protein of unknown function (DUF3833)
MRFLGLVAGVLLLAVSGCRSMKIEDFKGAEPKLALEEYFVGETRAWGMFEDLFGNLRRQFVVDITGTFDGKTLTLDERFVYNDGERQRRVWRIVRTGPETYEGRADDIIGVAQGRLSGNALTWSYQMDLPIGGRPWRVSFDDWMFLQPGGAMLNKADISKLGVRLGTVSIFFVRPGAGPGASPVVQAPVAP